MLIIIWEFTASQGREVDFEQAYGKEGAWMQLFARGEGYRGSDLLKDANHPGRYLTIDRWASQAAYDTFKNRWSDEYEILDRQCQSLTERENFIGSLILVDNSGQ